MKNLIIDGNGILVRYLFAMPEMYSPEGTLVNGLFGFCRCILQLIKSNKPYSMLITFDRCYDNFRRKISEDYKSNRKKLDNNAREQLNLALYFCQQIGLPVEHNSQYEADDLIASYIYNNPDDEFVIVGVDKDFCQLIDYRTKMYNPFKKLYIDRKYVLDTYNIPPELFHLFLALQGDSSDCIAGISGIGPKTAAKILNTTTEIAEMQRLFPKYDFSSLPQQIELVKLVKDIQLKNANIKKININITEAMNFFDLHGMNNLKSLLM